MLKLILDNYEFKCFDYGRTVGVRIYKEDDTAFDATGYTAAIVRVMKDGIQRLSDITLSWDTQASSLGHFALTSTNMFASPGIYEVEVELQKTGEITSTRSVEVCVFGSVA
jgi:hypothetical protein